MEKNKFAKMLHRRTNKLTRVLIYAFLEWTLIFLLLLNSLFSYLILKFALYFGLKPPCLFCSRLDHLLDSQKKHSKSFLSYKDIICEEHAAEISKVGYCSKHCKLFESKNLCDDCSSSSASSLLHQHDPPLFMWMKKVGIVRDDDKGEEEEDDEHMKICSCCDVIINNSRKVSSSLNFMANLITEREFAGCFPDQETGDVVGSDETDGCYQVLDDNDGIFEAEKQPLLSSNDDDLDGDDNKNKLCPQMIHQHLEFYVDHDDYRLIPVEFIGGSVKIESEIEESKEIYSREIDLVFEGDELMANYQVSDKNLPSIQEGDEEGTVNQTSEVSENEEKTGDSLQMAADKEETAAGDSPLLQGLIKRSTEENLQTVATEADSTDECSPLLEGLYQESVEENLQMVAAEEGSKVECLPSLEGLVEEKDEEEHSEISGFRQMDEEVKREIEIMSFSGTDSIDTEREVVSAIQYVPTVCNGETESHLRSDKSEIEVTESVEEKILSEVEENPTQCENECSIITDNASACEALTSTVTDNNDGKVEAEASKDTGAYAEILERSLHVNVALSSNDVEEDRVPETPTSVESFNHLHKRLLLGRMGSVTEESLDGSIISENEGRDAGELVEKLKLEVQAEKRALRALYAELEEERNASAIAANQTMAMITRIQEEKATMQMEALQYQRMMEEQSEYDQEALQMMNELMVKREKENQELEKEVEIYKKKLMEFEEREKMRILSRRLEGSARSRNSSASCSYGEDSDEAKDEEEDGGSVTPHCRDENGHQDTPTEALLSLHDSLASFEDERVSILEQLKLLELKLFTLSAEEEEHIDNMKPFDQFYEENGKDFDNTYNVCSDANGGDETDFAYQNGNHRLSESTPKRLLPLFDAAEFLDSADGTVDGEVDEFHSVLLNKSPITKFELEKKKLAIEEEVDQVYERLQALEADREFLKHCISSLKKGDKGLDLLQQILQHLRDLKNVELQVMKNMSPCASV